jgi:hypothetical protein
LQTTESKNQTRSGDEIKEVKKWTKNGGKKP